MLRIIMTYGTVSGTVAILGVIASIVLGAGEDYQEYLEWLGYLIMLVALSAIFIAIRRYRDHERGGVITFGAGFVIGCGIAAVAGVMYVIIWELYLAMTDYAFIHDYAQYVIANREASGVSSVELENVRLEMATMVELYGNPIFRLSITFMEIFPVGVLITLISAAVLRKSEVMPVS